MTLTPQPGASVLSKIGSLLNNSMCNSTQAQRKEGTLPTRHGNQRSRVQNGAPVVHTLAAPGPRLMLSPGLRPGDADNVQVRKERRLLLRELLQHIPRRLASDICASKADVLSAQVPKCSVPT